MHRRGGSGQFCEFWGFGGECREALLVCVHCFDGGSCFGELARTGCAMVADEEEEEDGEDERAGNDATRYAGFYASGETGAAGLQSVSQGEELGAYNLYVERGVGDNVGGSWSGDERE